MRKWVESLWPVMIVWMVTLWVFGGVLQNGFVQDDWEQIAENPDMMRRASVAEWFGGKSLFGDNGSEEVKHVYYKPVLGIWWWLNYWVWGGPSEVGFHLGSLCLHLVNVGLVYWVVNQVNRARLKKVGLSFRAQQSRVEKPHSTNANMGKEIPPLATLGRNDKGLFGSLGLAFWVAMVWGVHPGNVESVAYVSAGQELLFSLFGLVGLLMVVGRKRWRVRVGVSEKKWVWLVGLMWLLAALAKEPGLLVGLVGVLYLCCVEQAGDWKRHAKVLVGVWVVYVVMRVGVAGIGFVNRVWALPLPNATPWQQKLTVVYVLFRHIQLAFFPRDLIVGDYTVVEGLSGEWWGYMAGVVGLVGVMGYLVWRTRDRVLGWLLGWWVVATAIVSNIVMLDVTFADRWVYWPLVPMIWFWGRVVCRYQKSNVKNQNGKSRWSTWTMRVVLIALVVALGTRSWFGVRMWRDELSLARRAVEYDVGGFTMANSLGWELYKLGRVEEGKKWMEKAVEMNPDWWVTYNNLGVYYHEKGEFEKAEEMYLTAIEKGDLVLAWANLARLYRLVGDGRWRAVFETALEKYPRNQVLLEMKKGI